MTNQIFTFFLVPPTRLQLQAYSDKRKKTDKTGNQRQKQVTLLNFYRYENFPLKLSLTFQVFRKVSSEYNLAMYRVRVRVSSQLFLSSFE